VQWYEINDAIDTQFSTYRPVYPFDKVATFFDVCFATLNNNNGLLMPVCSGY
jgi:hypothetical protein